MNLKRLIAITMTAISMTILLTACGENTSSLQPTGEFSQNTDSTDATNTDSVNADINLDSLNKSVQAIQDLDLTGSSTDSDVKPSSSDASADTSKASNGDIPKGDYTPYGYADVYRSDNDLTVIPNGQLNASTVLFEDKDLGGFLDYVDSIVLEKGRTINRELFYDILSTMLVDKKLVSNQDSIEKWMMMALAVANNFHDLDITVKDCHLDATNAADYNYTIQSSGRDDIWIINYEKCTIYMNNGKTEYSSDLFKDEYLAVWLMAIDDYYGISR